MASTKVEIRDNRELRRVEALDEDGQVAGFAEYQISVDGDTFDFTHTEVDERFEGQGIGTRLAAGVMDFLREEGVKIVPSCSFIRHHMDKNEDTHDLLAEEASSASDDGTRDESEDETEESGEAAEAQEREDPDTDTDKDKDTGEDTGEDEQDDESADVDSPDAGPADAKAAGSGGAADEEASRS